MITASNLTKIFRLYKKPSDRLREIITGEIFHRNFHALSDVSFHVQEGETLGIIGENGSGKSTLLKILTGILLPDGGSFHVEGRITGLLELGTGFNQEFTGLSNIYMNGTYLGLSKAEIDSRLDQIVAFAELGDFIDEPIKTYSSGMIMRLAFAVAIHAEPRCFVVDEALSVGDVYFQQKCMKRLKDFRAGGGSIVFVSHDLNAVKVLCDKALLLDKGRVVEDGNPEDVVNVYNFLIAKRSKGQEIACQIDQEKTSYGNNKINVESLDIIDSRGNKADVLLSGKPVEIKLFLNANQTVSELTVGILIRDKFGQDIFGTNTFHMNQSMQMEQDGRCEVSFFFEEFNLGPGKYSVSASLHTGDTHVNECYQWVDRIKTFEVINGDDFIFIGISRLKPVLTIEGKIKAS
jgi:lipopolysaccharide transport system ATP-binding protein